MVLSEVRKGTEYAHWQFLFKQEKKPHCSQHSETWELSFHPFPLAAYFQLYSSFPQRPLFIVSWWSRSTDKNWIKLRCPRISWHFQIITQVYPFLIFIALQDQISKACRHWMNGCETVLGWLWRPKWGWGEKETADKGSYVGNQDPWGLILKCWSCDSIEKTLTRRMQNSCLAKGRIDIFKCFFRGIKLGKR